MLIDCHTLSPSQKQYWLQHLVGPRPICFASTVDKAGNVNLSPFSFFNLFSVESPIVIFSPSRRVRDNTTKHTLQNVIEVPEVVINMVAYDMVQQVSLASSDYEKGVDEFMKAGFTKERAAIVRPPMVRESPAQLECEVMEIKSLGNKGGAGQLVICEVLCAHIKEHLLDADKLINAKQLDLVARMGDNLYCRANEESIFEVKKPARPGIGIDSLPAHIRFGRVLTGNHLGQLAAVPVLPERDPNYKNEMIEALHCFFGGTERQKRVEDYAISLLEKNKVTEAWQVLLSISPKNEHDRNTRQHTNI